MLRRTCILGVMVLSFVASGFAQTRTASQDSVLISPGVQALIDSKDQTSYAPEYAFFFSEAKRFPPQVYDTLVSVLSRLEEKGFRANLDFKRIFGLLKIAKEDHNYSYEQLDGLVQVVGDLGLKNTNSQFLVNLQRLELLVQGIISNDRNSSILLKNSEVIFKVNRSYQSSNPIQRDGAELGPLEEPYYPLFEELGPVMKIQKGDLYIGNSLDTFAIYGTEGLYYIDKNLFSGQDGRLTWENRGYEADERFARLRQYSFQKGARQFDFENVLFMDRELLQEPAGGNAVIELSYSRSNLLNFPEFISYSAYNELKGIADESLTLLGGLQLKGGNIFVNNVYNQRSTLIGTVEGEKKFKASSISFVFDKQKKQVSAENAHLVLYHDSDSIVNAAVKFNYNYGTEFLTADANVDGFRYAPFRSSFFGVQTIGDRLSWDIKSERMDLTIVSAKREIPLIVESKDFFSLERYRELSQFFGFHPLASLIDLAPNPGDQVFIGDLAAGLARNEKLVASAMNYMKANGFVDIEESTGQITVLPKAIHYYNAYLTQRKEGGYDYDDLLIPSIIGSSPNATINLSDSTMTVRGIDDFIISDSLDVLIKPSNGEIKILQNRDIAFGGAVNAGNFQFNGTESVFRYDSFLIELTKIDSIELAVEIEEGSREALSNQLVNTSGVLRINEPQNKSALKSNPNYPIFASTEKASVSFGRDDVLEGAYDSTVYFDVPPYELDSVADADPTKYAFKGTLYSNGILPDFDAALKVMPDNSFGFIEQTPDSGYSLYGTQGRIYGQIQLDNSGITSTGSIKYLSAEFELEKSVFFLDSLVAENGLRARIRRSDSLGVSLPDLEMEEFSMNWLAKGDSMIIQNKDPQKPFKLYEGQAGLNGELILQSDKLIASGELDLSASNLVSDSITFNSSNFQSRHSDFLLRSGQSSRPILSSKDVYVNYDIELQEATIEPEVAGEAVLQFPFAQFNTSIPTAKWDIVDKKIYMSKPDSIDLNQSFFYSTNTTLDSLVFNAEAAEYDIESRKLKIEGIPYISVADARITPAGDSLTILENSRIDRLTNATIVLDTVNGYHRMFDAEIEIISRNTFRGKATYELVNALQDTFAIEFNDFVAVPESGEIPAHTKASGYVSGDMNVQVSSGFIFEGDITMSAYKKALELEGAVKLDLAGLSDRNIWIEYQSDDDIAEVVIPFDEALTRQGQPLNAGIHFDLKGDMYMSFITEKKDDADFDFFVPKGGNLYFDPIDSAFRIDNPLKSEDPNRNFAGSMFSYHEADQEVAFEGKLNFFNGPRGRMVQAAGKGRGNLDSAKFELNSMFVLSFGLNSDGLGAMAADLKTIGDNVGVPKTLDDRSEVIYRVAEFLGDDATRKWDNSFTTLPKPLYTFGDQLLKDIVITDVKLNWSKQNRAFYSEGKIGLSNISNVNLDQEVGGFMEIRKTDEGDIFTLLLELTDGTWYFFNYDGFTLSSFSSNEAFNGYVNSFNSGKNRVGSFNPLLLSQVEVIQWVTDFRKLYYGVDEPYRLLMAGDSQQKLKKKSTVEGDGF